MGTYPWEENPSKHGYLKGEFISETDRENLCAAAEAMQERYKQGGNWYDAVHDVFQKFPTVNQWALEAMWRAIDSYVEFNECQG